MADERLDSPRRIDSTALKGLADPLRMAIYDALSKHGQRTVAGSKRYPNRVRLLRLKP